MLQNNRIDRLDALILLSCESCIDEEVNEFYDQKIEHTMSERANRRILRMIRRYDRARKFAPYKRPLLIAAFAVMLAITLSFVACMSIPKVRKAIWKAITEWHDDYISFKFVPNDEETSNNEDKPGNDEKPKDVTDKSGNSSTSTDKPNDLPVIHIDPPNTIEKVNAPAYIPEGYTFEKSETPQIVQIAYYYNNELIYVFNQYVISMNITVDAEDAAVTNIDVNGVSATLISYNYEEIDNYYDLFWHDNMYAYKIEGIFTNMDELLRIACSVSYLEQ